jgi:adenosylcobinamide-phosphate synthase
MPSDALAALAILGLALLLDTMVGEYPAVAHPVVWMGRSISAGLRLAPSRGWWRQFLFGGSLTLAVVTASAGLTWLLLQASYGHPLLEIAAGTFFLKASFALRELGRAAMSVVRPIQEGNLAAARVGLRSLCSRDPSELNREELLAAAIASVAENASDSFVAPLLFYLLLGVPGAVGYRALNTLDAMIGYRGKFEALGKCAARLDDAANLLPARLTALLFLLTGWLYGGQTALGWRVLRRDGAKTPSPNAGRPMAVMAGLLDVQLNKKGVYSLGDEGAKPTPAKVRQAWRIVCAAAVVMAILCALALPASPEIRSLFP